MRVLSNIVAPCTSRYVSQRKLKRVVFFFSRSNKLFSIKQQRDSVRVCTFSIHWLLFILNLPRHASSGSFSSLLDVTILVVDSIIL